jgi:hypothetical protein
MPKKAAGSDLVVAKESFHTTYQDKPVFVARGELFRANHPFVKERADLFEPAKAPLRPDLEEATDEPGVKRGERRG